MNVLFLTLVGFETLQDRNLYTDLLREFCKNGHKVYVISPIEKRHGKPTHIVHEDNATILRLQIGNTQKTNIIEKGISTVLIEPQFKRGIKKYFSDVKFELVLYSTPPITLTGAVEYVKKRDGAKTYLLLKDIFPQNAVDIGMMSKSGLKGVLYRHFRSQEKKLYRVSDRIGCMSPANVDYLLSHNPEIEKGKVEVCPNSMEVVDMSVDEEKRREIREKYGIPLDKVVFVYGGNLGKPQGVPFIIECLEKSKDVEDAYFLIVGAGTERKLLEEYCNGKNQSNVKLMSRIPKEDYDSMVGACDVGLIFLDHRFTIPNFPSRLLSYMAAKIPVLAVTDSVSDVGKMVVEGGFGWWCESDDSGKFQKLVESISSDNNGVKCRSEIGKKGYMYLENHYTAGDSYKIIMKNL